MVPQIALVQEYFDHFGKLGFSLKLFGEQTVVVDAVPCIAGNQGVDTLFHRMIENLQEQPEKALKSEERIALTFSSHAGIRKGDALSQQEMNGLVNDLFATEMPYVTPSGRPIVVRMRSRRSNADSKNRSRPQPASPNLTRHHPLGTLVLSERQIPCAGTRMIPVRFGPRAGYSRAGHMERLTWANVNTARLEAA